MLVAAGEEEVAVARRGPERRQVIRQGRPHPHPARGLASAELGKSRAACLMRISARAQDGGAAADASSTVPARRMPFPSIGVSTKPYSPQVTGTPKRAAGASSMTW